MNPLSALALFVSSLCVTAESAKPVLATTNYPLTYFTERLAGDFAEILYQVPADEDPAFWKPNDAQITKIQQADLIIMNGATYEKWATTATLPFEGIVDTSLSFSDQHIQTQDAAMHSHGNEDPHSHGGTAFTTWLDLGLAAKQAEAVKNALVEDFPKQEVMIEAAYQSLAQELGDLDTEMKASAKGLRDAPVLASHPIYQYWARAYGVEVATLTWEPEMELDERALADLDALMKKNPEAKYFIWEGTPTPSHIETLRKHGLTSIIVAPCFSKPAQGNFLSVMRENIAQLKTTGSE